jgi:stearoyl-CoA desaturase (Delta-9 desaturase)
MSTAVVEPPATEGPAPKPLTNGKQPLGVLIALWAFVVLPFVALVAAVPVMWGWGLNWIDVVLFVIFYSIGAFGIGVGFHRHFTHKSFKAKRGLRIALAIAGSIAIRGRSCSGWPTTAGTTSSATWRATRTPRGGTGSRSGA